jgi:hypothetical protein
MTDRMTNPKIEALGGASGVQWASYRGVSLLLVGPASQHNPKRAAGSDPGICALHTDPDAPLYDPLRRVLQAISEEALRRAYGLAPVPSHALHVTAFDGINDGNLRDVKPAYRVEARRYLAGLPRSLHSRPVFARRLRASALARQGWDLEFAFRDLVIWGESVLAARLVPTDASQATFTAFCTARRELAASFARRFGPAVRASYEPHVTLGYFASPAGARRALRRRPEWSEMARTATQGATLRFRRVAYYGFTDMATFMRPRGSAESGRPAS